MPILHFHRGSSAVSVSARSGSTLLDQALSAGLPVEYSCQRGDCGQCVAQLEAGRVVPKDAGKPCLIGANVYLCNALPEADVVVRWPDLPETAHVRSLRSPCKIDGLARLSPDVLELSLRLPPTAQFGYVPGQFLRLTNREGTVRSYSLAAAPADRRHLKIQVARVKGGAFSDYLFCRAKIDDLLHLAGPMGRFVLRRGGKRRKTIFVATGTGIAPIHAMLSALTESQRQECGELFLYWGNRRRSDAYCQDRLVQLMHTLELRYSPVFSREGDGGASQANYVQDVLAAEHAELDGSRVYASGNPAMIEAVRGLSLRLGLPANDFFADPFTAS